MNKIVVNVILIFIVLFFLECYSYSTLFVSEKFSFPDYSKFDKIREEFLVDNHLYTNYKKPEKGDPIYFENDGRSLIGAEYKNKPIILLGDSYTYGLGLTKKETFGYQLSEYTKRPIYNWGWCTEGLEYPVLLLKDKRNIERLNGVSPEYVIYTYGYTAPVRINLKQRLYRWYYLRELSLLGNQKFTIFDKLYTVNLVKNHIFNSYLSSGDREAKMFNHITRLILEMSKDININFKDTKFVVLLYSDTPELVKSLNLPISDFEDNILNSDKWIEFEKNNSDKLIVISTEELIGRKMNKPEDIIDNERTVTVHPSAKAWSEIVPALVKKLNLN